jgi:conjugative transfer signal peptidase TraF
MKQRARGEWITLALAAFFAIGLVINANHLYYNSTPSEPVGEYWVWNGTYHRGDLALVCMTPDLLRFVAEHHIDEPLDSSSPCWNHTAVFIKQISGLAGDRVHTDARGIWINGHLLHNTAPTARSKELPLPIPSDYIVPPGKVVATSTADDSFDSRYGGALQPVNRAQLLLPDPFVHGAAADARPQTPDR